MIDLYYWPTPNGWKLSIALEELGLADRVMPVNIGRGEQFLLEFLAISPNNRIPALVDHDPPGGDAPFASVETGAKPEFADPARIEPARLQPRPSNPDSPP